MTASYRCPRCKNDKIIEYEKSFDCPICQLEFEKRDFKLYEEEDILSLEEKKDLVKILLDAENK